MRLSLGQLHGRGTVPSFRCGRWRWWWCRSFQSPLEVVVAVHDSYVRARREGTGQEIVKGLWRVQRVRLAGTARALWRRSRREPRRPTAWPPRRQARHYGAPSPVRVTASGRLSPGAGPSGRLGSTQDKCFRNSHSPFNLGFRQCFPDLSALRESEESLSGGIPLRLSDVLVMAEGG